jgi:hypothetical protein
MPLSIRNRANPFRISNDAGFTHPYATITASESGQTGLFRSTGRGRNRSIRLGSASGEPHRLEWIEPWEDSDLQVMSIRIICLAVLILISILDFAPFPVGSLLAIYIVLMRPVWFKDVVNALYGEGKP